MSRRSLFVVGAAAGALAAVLLRRRDRRRDRVTVGYEDGSSVTLDAGSDDADRLLALARPALAAR
jgi:hypothetical protein